MQFRLYAGRFGPYYIIKRCGNKKKEDLCGQDDELCIYTT